MRKGSFLWAVFLLPVFVFGAPHYSRLIVFGDSLSDIGNMPESPTLIEPEAPVIAMNLYVPISNPSTHGRPEFYTLVTTGKKYMFPRHAPQPQPPLQIGKITLARRAHSLGWSQFFTQRAADSKLLESTEIWPWFWWKTHKSDNPNLSINYAFVGALTGRQCLDLSYKHLARKTCSVDSILAGQAAYRAKGFNHPAGRLIDALEVPGLGKQVEIFLTDSKKYPELAQPDTLYMVLAGGNDLNFALMDLQKHEYLKGLDLILHKTAMRVQRSIEALIDQRGARHIVLFNMYDATQTPYIQNSLWQAKGALAKHKKIVWRAKRLPIKYKEPVIKALKSMVRGYNREMEKIVRHINRRYNKKYHRVDIQLFNFYDVMNKLQNQADFSNKTTLYQKCIDSKGFSSPSYYARVNKCINGDGKFLFWNDIHPTMYLYQVVADKLLKQLQADPKRTHIKRPADTG